MNKYGQHGSGPITVLLALLVILIIGTVFVSVNHNKRTPKQVTMDSKTCIAKQIDSSSTGNCVSDVQTMIDFMETDKLTECPFNGAIPTPINGLYDSATQAQVKTVQTWINCYNKEEGSTTPINVTGVVSPATWHVLCSYGYKFPKQSASNTSLYAKQTLSAGADAGCDRM
jgi:hypothetical protein